MPAEFSIPGSSPTSDTRDGEASMVQDTSLSLGGRVAAFVVLLRERRRAVGGSLGEIACSSACVAAAGRGRGVASMELKSLLAGAELRGSSTLLSLSSPRSSESLAATVGSLSRRPSASAPEPVAEAADWLEAGLCERRAEELLVRLAER